MEVDLNQEADDHRLINLVGEAGEYKSSIDQDLMNVEEQTLGRRDPGLHLGHGTQLHHVVEDIETQVLIPDVLLLPYLGPMIKTM